LINNVLQRWPQFRLGLPDKKTIIVKHNFKTDNNVKRDL
jgi:hypothetical protein